MSYKKIPITVMVSTGLQVDPDNLTKSLTISSKPNIRQGEGAILCFHFIDSAGADYAIDSGDTFEFGADRDYVHYAASGNLSGAITAGASLTSIIAKSGLATSSVPSTGHIWLVNSSNQTERIAYTAFDSSNLTFTVSATAAYSYSDGATLKIEDDLMIYSGSSKVDISGDWSEIDRSKGKISVRIDSNTDAMSTKMDAHASNGVMQIVMELRRYPSGDTIPTVMYQDAAKVTASVIGESLAPSQTAAQLLTQSSADSRYSLKTLTDETTGTKYELYIDNGVLGIKETA